MEKKIKCFELDFGDTKLISENIQDILDWIKADMENLYSGDTDTLLYEINIKELTRYQIDKLPEWA